MSSNASALSPLIKVTVYSDLAYRGASWHKTAYVPQFPNLIATQAPNSSLSGNRSKLTLAPIQTVNVLQPIAIVVGEEADGRTIFGARDGRITPISPTGNGGPNTTKAHQFVSFASQKCGVSTDAANQFLFDALYEKGENISLTETLVRIGFDSGGILAGKGNTDELRSFLERDEGKDEMLKAIKLGRSQYSITSVPFFIIEREGSNARPYGLSGAQKSSAFRATFEKLMTTAGNNKDSD
eukprot:CAMPEP_0194384100 /NCGR_PEP_ID=MMETSP0174-20130528/71884_1 /TAXON_ID=216777 /ORGANISM="Proboscia alata, Strain PI-D3" /LENGTH=239 /DNA_ID=CAMNT_0039170969 /DNA_START=82 /DNA_END=804 /DNA_ORIENTATION=-